MRELVETLETNPNISIKIHYAPRFEILVFNFNNIPANKNYRITKNIEEFTPVDEFTGDLNFKRTLLEGLRKLTSK